MVAMFSRVGLWLVFPFAVFMACVFWPLVWLLKYGWVNSPFWHNVRAGWLQAVAVCFK